MKQALLVITLAAMGCSPTVQNTETFSVDNVSDNACEIPSSFTPLKFMGVPHVDTHSTEIKVTQTHVQIDLLADNQVSVNVRTELVNRGSSDAHVKVGYLQRVPEGLRSPIQNPGLAKESGNWDLVTCSVDSPRNFQRPFTDTASYVTLSIDPGATKEITFEYQARTKSSNKANTLFGYKDVFAQNWKNWSWPYTQSPIFEEIADTIELSIGHLTLGNATRTTVDIRGNLRGLSHEQNLTKLEKRKSASWSFLSENTPTQLTFEHSVNDDFERELDVFTRLVTQRPNDLRALIHLSDLYMVSDSHDARIETLNRLLDAWEINAQDQMLSKLNDIRAAVYIGLVRSLLALGKKEEAKAAAKTGVEVAEQLEQDGPKWTQNALTWLKKHI